MAYTVAITNQKGGVGKTTTAVNLAAAIAIADRRTLLVDADPQGNTTSGVGIAKLELQVSLYDVLVDGHPAQDVILPVPGLPHLWVLPATQDLVGAELQLVERPFRESALRRVLEPIAGDYDYIIVDCPPSLGLLTLNVLAAVQAVIIPIQCEYYGLEGISQLLNTVRLVQQNINPGLAIGGVLLTMYDSRLNLCRQVAEDATEYFGPKVFGTPIPRNVRLAEAPSFGKPILLYDVQSVGAKSYLAVGQELVRRVEGADAPVMAASVAPSSGREVERAGEAYVAGGRAGGAPAPVVQDAEGRTDDDRRAEHRPGEYRIDESQSAETQSGETRTDESQVGESQVAQSGVAESQVAESQSGESQVSESQIDESQIAEAPIAESDIADSEANDSPSPQSQISPPQIGEPQVDEPQIAEPQAAERHPEDPWISESQDLASQDTESQPPESQLAEPRTGEPEPAEPNANESHAPATRVAESQAHPTGHEPLDPQPRESDPTTPRESAPRAESPEFDESAQPSKPPSQHLPEVTT